MNADSTGALSQKALAVCAWHYSDKKTGCGKCPIQEACKSGTRGRLTQTSLNDWQQRVNDAAEKVTL